MQNTGTPAIHGGEDVRVELRTDDEGRGAWGKRGAHRRDANEAFEIIAAASLFLMPGLDAPDGAALCTDSELASYVVTGLGLPPDYREAKAARTVAERCWESLKTAIVANVARETEASYYLQNACPSLIQRKALTGLREKRCQALVQP